MKSLVRWGTTVTLVGSTLVGSLVAGGFRALALTPEQVMQKLRSVPVFTIANAQGAPLVATPPQGQQGAVAGVFISQRDAQAFLQALQTKNPNLAKEVKVVPVSLAEVYQLNQANQGKKDKLDFAYVPTKQQVASAVALLKQSGQKVDQFGGTPLFVARAGKEKGFLTVQEGDRSVIPMFFNKEDLNPLLENFKKQQPNLAATVDIQVFPLEGVMEALKKENDPQLDKVVLVPPKESIEFLRSQQPAQKPAQGGAPRPQAQPAPAPAKK
ncbi:Tic22 family protein [Myxacorys almedinensis]|uniref:Tic22 family protein n=1 Tax=Myxacorys almedinensis A TaxID=2690445 RepID=A0A8J7Z4E2_9CYAN|nr:Tic22 family protein [Myxacorys almedinensis]NDJ16243.1 hypothetical protein [Myxacorys almedinensis A]